MTTAVRRRARRSIRAAALVGMVVTAATLATSTAPAQSLTTTFAGGNSGRSGWTNQFDVDVLATTGIRITAFDVHCETTRSGGVGSRFTLDVWVTAPGGSYLGRQNDPSAWTLVASGTGISRRAGLPTPVDVADFDLPPGRHGIALVFRGTAMSYSLGTATFANPDLRIETGSATASAFGTPVYHPRTWNGTIYYFAGPATWRSFGEGCAHSGGTSRLAPAPGARPSFGSTLALEVDGLPSTPHSVIVFAGGSTTTWNGLALPLDLGLVGAPGCTLRVAPIASGTSTGVGPVATLPVAVPNNTSLSGVAVYFQAVVVDLAGPNPRLAITNAGEAYLGT